MQSHPSLTSGAGSAQAGISSFDAAYPTPPTDELEPAPPPYEAISDISTTAFPTTSTSDYAAPASDASNSLPRPPLSFYRHPSYSGSWAPTTSSGSSPTTPTTQTSPTCLLSPQSQFIDDSASLSGHSIARSGTSSSSSYSGSSSSHPHSLSDAARALGPSSHASFDRRPPRDVPYGAFPPATHYAHADDLTRGFPLSPPTCACAPAPHPFVTHDVNEEDWRRFLEDVKGAGGLKPMNALLADAAPTMVMTGFIGGYLASKALKAHVKSKRKSPVAEVIELWNRRFFHPRCMDAVLAQGLLTYTGPVDTFPPDMVRPSPQKKKDKHVKVIEDHSDDEGGSGSSRLDAMGAAVGAAGEQFMNRGTYQRGRIAFGYDLKHSARERWRVILTYKPPVL